VDDSSYSCEPSIDEKAVQSVIGSLLTARNNTKNHPLSLVGEFKDKYQLVSVPEGTFILGSEGISCIDHAVELITVDTVLGERFSRGFISDRINRLLPGLMSASDFLL